MNYNCISSQVMDVIVIGCGASGVAALRKLHDAGLKVMGLEAADRIGGRIWTTGFADNVVDIGAAWCHGEKDNLVYEIANPLNLLGRPEPDNKWYVLSNGELIEEGVAQAILTAIDLAVATADKNNTMSVSECVRSAANTNEVLKSDPHLTNHFIEWYERNNHCGGQSDPRKGKSLHGLEECWPCEGEFMLNWKGRGYVTILDVLCNKYPDPSKKLPITILKQKEVECIKWRANQPECMTATPLVHVKCKDGSLYATKSVIVTMSVGVMKERHEHLFQPPLPIDKVNAINTLQLCVLDKIYIEFQKPWWPKSPANFTILWRQEDKQQFSKDERWVTEIYGLNTVEHQPNVILAWIYGTGAEEMEKITTENVQKGVEKLLKVMFSRFHITPINNIIRSQWSLNPLARGAYAYRSVMTEQDGGSAAILGEPLYHADGMPIVCFAGEATSFHRHGAVHGAIEAGYREADRLICSFKKPNN